MMEVFHQSGLKPKDVDEVVLTGGTAQFNQIQKSVTDVFGKEKLIEHDIFQSVIGGLSQFALQQFK
jgi:molecular chaperone DnaK (HSP70)